MKHVVKRTLALLIALMLVIPSLAFADTEVVTDLVDGVYEQEVRDLGEETTDSPAEEPALSAAKSVAETPDAGEETGAGETPVADGQGDGETSDAEAESAETSDVAVELVDEESDVTELFAEEIDGVWTVSASPAFSADVEQISASNVVLFEISDDHVAAINETGYATLAAAVEAAQSGDTITLRNDINLPEAIVVSGKEVTIVGDGEHTITTAVTDAFQANGGTITLGSDLTIEASSSALYAHNKGVINIDGANVIGTGNDYAFAYATGSGSEINVLSGSLVKNGSNHATLVIANGANSEISGGTVSNDSSTTIVAEGGGSITVSGGEVSTTSNYVAGYARGEGTIEVTGGNITSNYWCTLSAITWNYNKGGTIEISGGTINNAVGAYETATSSVLITGGTIGSGSWAVYINNGAAGTITDGTFNGYVSLPQGGTGTLEISGGSFDRNVNDSYIVKDYGDFVLDEEGRYIVRKPIVTFYMDDYYEDVYATQEVNRGGKATEPDEPSKIGKVFLGWYAEGEEGVFDFSTPINEDVSLIADWEYIEYTLTFADTGDTAIAPVTYYYGEEIIAPKDPTRAGYTFAGWDPALPATMPDKDLTVTAKWTAQTPEPHAPAEGVLVATMRSSGKSSLKLTWTAVSNVEGYDIFINRCNTGGKKYELESVASVPAGSARAYVAKNLKKHTFYKATVKAYYTENGAKVYAAESPLVHAATTKFSGSQCNPKAVKVGKSKLSLKAGKTKKLKVSVTKTVGRKKLVKNHAAKVRYISSDTSVATVSAKGKVKAVAKGTCNIYCIAANGVYKTVKVTVK